MPLTLSKSAFAARRGVGSSTVSNWIARGRLTGKALVGKGAAARINVEEAERQLGALLDQSRSAGAILSHAAAEEPAPPASAKALAPEIAPLAAIKLEQAQRALQRDRESDLERRGVYVRAADMRREQARQLAQLITMIEQRLPELVALLGGGKPEIVTARRWWRSLRQTEAAAARETASPLPEFIAEHQAEPREAAYAA